MHYLVDPGLGFIVALSFVVFVALGAYAGAVWLAVPIAAVHLAVVYLTAFAFAARGILRTS